MSNLARQDAPQFQFCDDFGDNPLLLAHLTHDRSVIGVAGLVGGFLGLTIGGFPLVALVGFAAINDLVYAGKQPRVLTATPPDPENQGAITVEAETTRPTQHSKHRDTITVQAETIQPTAQQVAAPPSSGVSRILAPLDRLLASPYQSRAIFGAQRTGKSYLAAIATQQMSLKGTQVFHVNLHSYGDEDARYWTHARSVRGDMGHLPEQEVADLISRAIGLVRDFTATRDAILIVDEITLTGATANPYAESLEPLLKAIASICSELASTGKKRQQAIWTLSPDFVAGMLTQPTKAIKSLAVTFVAIPPGRSVDWQGQAIGFHAESFANIQRNYPALTDAPAMDCDRMVFVDGLWLDLGKLPELITVTYNPEPPTDRSATVEISQPTQTKKMGVGDAAWERIKVGNRGGLPEAIEVEATIVKDEPADYADWDEYPIHQAVLQYLHGKQGKSTRYIYNCIRHKLPAEVWQSIPGDSNMSKTEKAVQWLAGRGLIEDEFDGTYSGLTNK